MTHVTIKFLGVFVAGLYAADGTMALASAKDGAGGQVSIAVLHIWARCSALIAADVQHAQSAPCGPEPDGSWNCWCKPCINNRRVVRLRRWQGSLSSCRHS
jgi:hypothetical protein